MADPQQERRINGEGQVNYKQCRHEEPQGKGTRVIEKAIGKYGGEWHV